MADLDDEFARFQAELASLEELSKQTKEDAESVEGEATQSAASAPRKRARDDDTADTADTSTQPPAKRAAAVVSTAAPVVIKAKPRVYSAPPRPVPVRNATSVASSSSASTAASVASSQIPSHYAAPSSSATAAEATATAYAPRTSSGALSGFPMGTTGEYAARSSSSTYQSHHTHAQAPMPAPVVRVDMLTGQLMSPEEQNLMNMQQSAYEYDPTRAVRNSDPGAYPATSSGGAVGSAMSSAAVVSGSTGDATRTAKPKRNIRMAGGEVWEDATLADWPDNDFRLFIGDLGNEVNDEILCHAFSGYASFQRARVVRDKNSHKTRGYGFISFSDPFDCAKALREMNGKYIGNRPVKIQKSKWQDRNIAVARKRARKKKHHLFG